MHACENRIKFMQVLILRDSINLQLKFNKNYEELEDAERFEIFKVNLKKIEEHNARYDKVMNFK